MSDRAKWVWLPEDELVIAVGSPYRAELVVAAAVEQKTGLGMVLVATGDGKVRTVHPSKFAPSGCGLAPDFTRVRPADHGRTLALGEYEAASDATLDDAEAPADGTLFDPGYFDGTQADDDASAEQQGLLDRAVAVLNRSGERIALEDLGEWQAVVAGLRKSVTGYGGEWIHRGWDLMLHGHQLFCDRMTPEVAQLKREWWEKFLNRPKPPVEGERVPVVEPAALK